MRISVWHGYLLAGTGSNILADRIAAIVRLPAAERNALRAAARRGAVERWGWGWPSVADRILSASFEG